MTTTPQAFDFALRLGKINRLQDERVSFYCSTWSPISGQDYLDWFDFGKEPVKVRGIFAPWDAPESTAINSVGEDGSESKTQEKPPQSPSQRLRWEIVRTYRESVEKGILEPGMEEGYYRQRINELCMQEQQRRVEL